MSQTMSEADSLEMRMMEYVLRDEETDEITGISDDAPDNLKSYFKDYMQALESPEPIVR